MDRKFSAGKAQCPVSGCHQMLWKRDWRTQTYEDIQVEREVDIRRRIWKIFDLSNLGLAEDPQKGWENAFEDLRSYNDYLELKEEMAMNLIYNTDVAATNKKLREFETANGLRKEKDESKPQPAKPPAKTGDYPDASKLIRGLRTIYIPKALSPYKAFGELSSDREYYNLADSYETPIDRNKRLKDLEASGYSFEAFVDESLLKAFSGLGVFIENEKGGGSDMAMPLMASS